MSTKLYDAIVVGGGPAGATAARELAAAGRSVALIDRAGRIKPCGGAIPPRLLTDFAVPDSLLVARSRGARIISPSTRRVDMPIDGSYVGLVDREMFDEWLRQRAHTEGAERIAGLADRVTRDADGHVTLHYRPVCAEERDGESVKIRARALIAADGAASTIARQTMREFEHSRYVAAYHEILEAPSGARAGYDPERCDVWYQGDISPDFYGWVFPHGRTVSVGVGSAERGFSLRSATARLRERSGLADARVVRREGAPLPLKPLPRWDDGRNVVLAGDAAGVVAPASGEGIYYAMVGGRYAADAVDEFLGKADVRALASARRRFMKEHGTVFWMLGIMQRFWYVSDRRRERFVKMCADPDVQRLTWESYLHKRMPRSNPLAQVRVFLKDSAHLLGLARV